MFDGMTEDAPQSLDHARDLGPAALARASRLVSVEGRSRGSASPGESVQAVRVLDLPARLHAARQITDRQYVAARRLLRLWWATRLEQRMSGGYGERRGGARGCSCPAERCTCPPAAEDAYHALMRQMPGHLIGRVRDMLDDIAPRPAWLATLRAGLDWCGDYWEIEARPDPADEAVVVDDD